MPHNIRYVSVDLETTGLNENNCQILEFGAVYDDGVTAVEDLPFFHCYVQHDLIQGEPYALSMHPAILKGIATGSDVHTLKPYRVGEAFALWLHNHNVDPQHVLAAGKNFAAFDLQFLKRVTGFTERVHFKHRFIDPGNLYLMPGDVEPPSTKLCMERAGIAGEVAHTAVEDARVVVKLVRHAMTERGATY